MARVITRGRPAQNVTSTLWFNYSTATTSTWMQPALAEEYRYRVAGPTSAGSGVSIRLSG